VLVALFVFIGMIIFQGVLFAISGVSVLFSELNNGFIGFVDVASKIATISVFVWAVHTFIEQQRTKKNDEKYLRLKDLSYRIIDYVGNENFILNKNTASILIAYLEAIKEEKETEELTAFHLKEHKLSLNVTYEALKKTTLKEVFNVDEENDYRKIVEKLKSIYSDHNQISEFDCDLYDRLNERSLKSTNMRINVPSFGIQLWQIKRIMSLVLECEEALVEEELSRGVNSILDRHHHFPVLYAIYYIYENGIVHVQEDDQISFSTNGILMAGSR